MKSGRKSKPRGVRADVGGANQEGTIRKVTQKRNQSIEGITTIKREKAGKMG